MVPLQVIVPEGGLGWGFSAQHLPFPWAVLLLFGPSPDLVVYALGSSPGGSGEFGGAELYGGGQAASGQSLQGAERKVGEPGLVLPWAELLQVLWRKDKRWGLVRKVEGLQVKPDLVCLYLSFCLSEHLQSHSFNDLSFCLDIQVHIFLTKEIQLLLCGSLQSSFRLLTTGGPLLSVSVLLSGPPLSKQHQAEPSKWLRQPHGTPVLL